MLRITLIVALLFNASISWGDIMKKEYPIGSQGPDIETVLKNVVKGESTPAPQTFGNIKADVTDTWFGDSRYGKVLLREARIPDLQGGKRAASWLIGVQTKGEPTYDEFKASNVIAASFSDGKTLPITAVKISDNDVSYELFNPFSSKTEKITGKAKGYDYDRLLIYSMAAWAETTRAAYDATEVKNRINTDFQPESPIINNSLNKTFSEVLTPLYKDLSAINSSNSLKKSYAKKDPLMMGLLEVFMRQADSELKFSKEQLEFRIKRHTHLDEAFVESMRHFTWEGKNLNRGQVFEKLREEKDPAKREALYRHFANYYGKSYEAKDNLFGSIPEFNKIARNVGETGYADLIYKIRFGFDTKYFSDVAKNYFDQTNGEAKAYIDLIRPKKGEPVHLQDVEYLDAQKSKGESNAKEIKLKPDQAFDIVKKIFLDMGIDLTKEPFSNIVLDDLPRPKKVSALGEALAATPTESYVMLNLDPKAGVSLDELSTFLHEFVHAVQFQASQASAGGYMGIKDLWLAPQDFPEGIAITIERLLNEGDLAYSYLGKYGFSKEFLETRGQVRKLKEAWDRRKLFLIALQEITLYTEKKPDGTPWPMEERIAWWNQKVRDILFVEPPKGLLYGEWAAKPHFTGKDYYLYYGAYPAGGTRTDLIFDKYVKKGAPKELKHFGAATLALFEKGSLVTSDDILKAGK